MTKINLLAPELIRKEEHTELVIVALVMIIVFIMFAVTQYSFKLRNYNNLQKRLELTKQELLRYESILRQVEALKSTKAILEAKKNVINNLRMSRLFYPRYMEDILQILPANISFRSMTTNMVGITRINVTIDAEASDVFSVADFISALLSTPNFSNAELRSLSTQFSDKQQISSFNLTFDYEKN